MTITEEVKNIAIAFCGSVFSYFLNYFFFDDKNKNFVYIIFFILLSFLLSFFTTDLILHLLSNYSNLYEFRTSIFFFLGLFSSPFLKNIINLFKIIKFDKIIYGLLKKIFNIDI